MSLLGHQVVELLLGYQPVVVEVSPLDHVLKGRVVGQFSHVLGHLPEVLQSDEACIDGILPFF